jgi:hypothetical protein
MMSGAFFVLIMSVAVAVIAITVYPVLKIHNERIALGYVASRVAEGVIYLIHAISLLLLVVLSRKFVAAGAPEASYFQTIGELLRAVGDWGVVVVLDVAVFAPGALIFYYLLYRANLIPRWLSVWGMIAAILYFVGGWLILFAVIEPMSTIGVVSNIPLALQEMVLSIWLIVKGFNPSALVPDASRTDLNKVSVNPEFVTNRI